MLCLREEINYMIELIADENYRGRGIGKQSIRKIIDNDAESMNIEEIRLNVRQENVRAISCYFGLGFKEIGGYTKENGINVISMSLAL